MLFHILDVLVRQKMIFSQEVEIDQNDKEKNFEKNIPTSCKISNRFREKSF